ncbi:Brp/Blh family beta-carotene 15,15'-dioxygenase [Ekhidna sp.]|uniref:Brp/Blh family beta-carotene 15,15'-dioxygenase n=1 Tax=Ekhidna sp. TaxID=2608089 RepID=UPI003296B646
MFKIVQYGLACMTGVIFLAFNLSTELINSICLVLILLFGIPHGGVDHLIHASTSSDSNVLKYIIKYLLIAGGYILWWLIDPSKALFIFIILSAYHFGQEFIADMRIKGQNVVLNLIWGSVILIGPMIFSYQEIAVYLQIIIPNLPVEISPILKYTFPIISILLAIGSVFWLRRQNLTAGRIYQIGLFLCVIILSHILLPFIPAFTIYFILFHSTNAFKHQFSWLKEKKDNYHFGKFIIDLVGFSLLAILGILGLIWILKPESQATLVTYFFILTSLITLPHAITLDQFYRFRNTLKMGKAITESSK